MHRCDRTPSWHTRSLSTSCCCTVRLSGERPATVGSEVLKRRCSACLSLFSRGRSPSLFLPASDSLVSVLGPQLIHKRLRTHSHVLCNGALFTGTKPDYILCVPCARYWAHLGLTTYKKEVLSIMELEAMAEKQPRSRKELSMLYTDKLGKFARLLRQPFRKIHFKVQFWAHQILAPI